MSLAPGHRRLKDLRRLINDRAARRDGGLFVIEGPVLTLEALQSDLVVKEVFVEERIFASGKNGDLFTALRHDPEVEYTDVANGALDKILSTRTPQPVAAVVEVPQFWSAQELLDPEGLSVGKAVLGLIDIADPGNLGTMLRTAEAAGVGGVIIAGSSVDVTNPKVVRASAGSVLRLRISVEPDLGELRFACDQSSRSVFNAVVSDIAIPYEDCALADGFICLGNEARGLPAEWTSAVGTAMTIRLAGPTESLNVAASAAIIVFESLRQRRTREGTMP